MSAKPVPIYKGRDFYVPAFEVKINRSPLERETLRDVMEVRYTDTIDQFDTFELTINNWDDEARDFKYTGPGNGQKSDPKKRYQLFDPGQEVELWMGYFKPPATPQPPAEGQGPLRLMLTGVITKLAPAFPAAGQPTLKVSGVNSLVKLIKKQETHTYKEKLRDSEIAMEIDKRGRLTFNNVKIPIETNPEAKNAEPENVDATLQFNQYDILFLLQLAHRNGYDLVLRSAEKDGQVKQSLYFGPSTLEPPQTFLLEWGKSLVSFNPTMKTMKQVKELTVKSWNALKGKPISVTVKREDLPTRGLLDEERLYRIEQGFGERAEIVADHPFRSEAEARKYALGLLSDISKNLVTAKGSTLGTTGIRAGQKIEVQNLGPTFSGPYFITSSTHTIGGGGYLTEFDARLEVKK